MEKKEPDSYVLRKLDLVDLQRAEAEWLRQITDLPDALPSHYIAAIRNLKVVSMDPSSDSDAYGLFFSTEDTACALVEIHRIQRQDRMKMMSIRLEPKTEDYEGDNQDVLAAMATAIVVQSFNIQFSNGDVSSEHKLLCDGALHRSFLEGVCSRLPSQLQLRTHVHKQWLVIRRFDD